MTEKALGATVMDWPEGPTDHASIRLKPTLLNPTYKNNSHVMKRYTTSNSNLILLTSTLKLLVCWIANYACLPRATVREIETTVKDQLSYISHHFWFLREPKRSFLVPEWNNFFKMRIFLS